MRFNNEITYTEREQETERDGDSGRQRKADIIFPLIYDER